MGTTTTNFALYKPAISETGWGTLINATLDTIDTKLNSPTIAATGMTIGSDVNLYRSAANVLKTDDSFTTAVDVNIPTGNLKVLTGSDQYVLKGRLAVIAPNPIAVPYFQPTTNNSNVALDLFVKGAPTDLSSDTGAAWIDICSTDVADVDTGYESLRLGKFVNGSAHVSASKGGTGTVRDLVLQLNGGNVQLGPTGGGGAAVDALAGTVTFQTSNDKVALGGRASVGFGVAYFQSTANNKATALDVYTKGSPTDVSSDTGVAWIDVCSTDVAADPNNFECLRLGKFASGVAHVSASKSGTGTVRDLVLQKNGGKVQIASSDTNLYRKSASYMATDGAFGASSGFATGNSAAGTVLGSVVKKMEIFKFSDGSSLGYIPIYDAIT